MKIFVIILLIALCFQDILEARIVRNKSPSDTKAEKSSPAKDTIMKKSKPVTKKPVLKVTRITTIKAPESTSTIKSKPLTEIPSISSKKEMVIKGENEKISVDGILLYNDEEFKKGNVHLTSPNGHVYINGNLIAKNPNDGTVDFLNPTINDNNVGKFEIKIQQGDVFTYKKDGGPTSYSINI